MTEIETRDSFGFVGKTRRQVQDVRAGPQTVDQGRHLGTLGTEVEAMVGPVLMQNAKRNRRPPQPVGQVVEHALRGVMGLLGEPCRFRLRLDLNR
jgi:hypothetical protein